MVSRKQSVLAARRLVCLAAIATASTAADLPVRKFYADDPLWHEPAPRPVKKVATRKVDDIYDFLENSYVTPRREGKQAKLTPRPALDINTLGEVADGDWYTNRHAFRRMSIADLQRGPGNTTPPRKGAWTIVGAKSDGVTPGFVIEDESKNRYLLKLDPPQSPELCSAADVIGSKFFYALGYFTPENYIVHFQVENLTIPPGATWRDSEGRKRPLTRQTVKSMLRTQSKERGGTYRALASRWVEGEVVGPFSYRGTRSDDPNDTIPHQDRRVLRGLKVFSAWLNHHDTRSINSMDTLVGEGSARRLKHYLIDFGSILGSAGYEAKEPWMGHVYALARPDPLQALTLGFYVPRWMRADYPKLTGVGLLDSWAFDPLEWKSNYPNPAFLMMDREDAFWAAKQVASFTDDEIRAIVETGELSDPRAAAWISKCLIERRDKIAAAWFAKVLPLHNFRVADGSLAFDDLLATAEARPRRGYNVSWSSYDNERGASTPLTSATGMTAPALPGSSEYLAATIRCASAAEGPCANPVTVYLQRAGGSLRVVGVDR